MAATFNRTEFLRMMAISPFALLGQAPAGAAAGETRAAAIIEEYDRQGIHRTATPVDAASAKWLIERARATGATPSTMNFAVNRIEPTTAFVQVGGKRIDGLPLFDGGLTNVEGVSGPFGAPEALPAIALVTLNGQAIRSEGRSIEALRRSTTLRAIVAVTNGDHPGLSPSNAYAFGAPYGVPVLQVSSEHAEFLDGVAATGATARIVAFAARTRAAAINVIAEVPGKQKALPPVIVMTPRSGWWNCASERGGGLACWLEIMRAAVASRANRPFLFLASSGHELGHFGLEAFLAARPALIKSATWIHLGANIGAAGGTCRLQASDEEIDAMATRALAVAGAPGVGHRPRGTVPEGEARNIHLGGGRYISVLGDGPFFHSEADRFPATVDVPAIARFATALAGVAIELGQ
jgi:hypothetical protein